MKAFTFFITAALVCTLASTSFIRREPEEQLEDIVRYNSDLNRLSHTNNNLPILTTCGGVLNTTTGGISYKAFEPIAANERCVWTIRGGRAGGFSLNVFKIGSANSKDTNVIATCLRHRQIATHVSLNQSGIVSEVSSCNLLVITFASGIDVSSSTGFVLEYTATGAASISPKSEDYIVNSGNAAIIRYPNSAPNYSNNELTTFVILPDVGSTSNVIYFERTLDLGCYDSLLVYKFNASSSLSTKWQYEGRICSNSDTDLIANEDLILITFDSDDWNPGTGFQLVVAASSSPECLI